MSKPEATAAKKKKKSCTYIRKNKNQEENRPERKPIFFRITVRITFILRVPLKGFHGILIHTKFVLGFPFSKGSKNNF